MCLAIVKKACSTLVESLAEVSKKGILSCSANSYTCVRKYDDEKRDSHLCHVKFDRLL